MSIFKPKAIITDIEGTTSSLSFVKDVLFPYAYKALPDYVRGRFSDPQVAQILQEVSTIADVTDLEDIIKVLLSWIIADKKVTPLKVLQGYIWEEGYIHNDFTGHVYEDAVRNLKVWHELRILLYVYSSGSVEAQKLLFGYSDFGDMTSLFSGYFDTNIGGKKEAQSYKNIARQLNRQPQDLLFLSDIHEELYAAQAAGWQVIWLNRNKNINRTPEFFEAQSFDDIKIER